MVRSNAENYFMNETRSIFYTHTHTCTYCVRVRVVHDYPVTRPKREKRVYELSVEYKCRSAVVTGARRRSSNGIGLAAVRREERRGDEDNRGEKNNVDSTKITLY